MGKNKAVEHLDPVSIQAHFEEIARREIVCSRVGSDLSDAELEEAYEELKDNPEVLALIEARTLELLMQSREANELAINYQVTLMATSGYYRYHPSNPTTLGEHIYSVMERYDHRSSMYANAMTVATLIVPYLIQSGQQDKIARLWMEGTVSKTRELANIAGPLLRADMGLGRGRKSPVGEEESRKISPETRRAIDQMIEAVQNDSVSVEEFRSRFRGHRPRNEEPLVVWHELRNDGGGVITIEYQNVAQLRYLERVLKAPNCDWRLRT